MAVMKLDELSTFLEALTDSAFLINGQREVVAANRIAKDIFDASINGRDLALSLRHPNVLEAVDRVLAGETTRETLLEQTAPLQRVFGVRVAALANGPDGRAMALCILRDITAVQETERMRADFVANVSHELRSPLTSLIGFIETLRGHTPVDIETQKRFLGIMDVEARRMARLVDDLLSLSRIEAQEHICPTDIVDIRKLLGDLIAAIEPRALRKGIKIHLDCDPDSLAVHGDRDELEQAFHNLVDNAIKYGPAKELIDVRMRARRRIPDLGGIGVSITIINSGDLIAAENLPRLTERFYRIKKGRSDDVSGTGLGLAIVKHIVNRHRGRLTIESTAETGNSFTVYLPMVE